MKTAIVLGVAAIIATIAAWTAAIPAAPPADLHRATGGASLAPSRLDTTALASSATRLRTRDPFRLARRPTDLRYNPWETTPPVAPPPAAVRPPLSLAGLLGGPPWTALIEGIPGREGGVLLELGDSTNGVRFVAVHGDTVILVAFDTTWSLIEKREWR